MQWKTRAELVTVLTDMHLNPCKSALSVVRAFRDLKPSKLLTLSPYADTGIKIEDSSGEGHRGEH